MRVGRAAAREANGSSGRAGLPRERLLGCDLQRGITYARVLFQRTHRTTCATTHSHAARTTSGWSVLRAACCVLRAAEEGFFAGYDDGRVYMAELRMNAQPRWQHHLARSSGICSLDCHDVRPSCVVSCVSCVSCAAQH